MSYQAVHFFGQSIVANTASTTYPSAAAALGGTTTANSSDCLDSANNPARKAYLGWLSISNNSTATSNNVQVAITSHNGSKTYFEGGVNVVASAGGSSSCSYPIFREVPASEGFRLVMSATVTGGEVKVTLTYDLGPLKRPKPQLNP